MCKSQFFPTVTPLSTDSIHHQRNITIDFNHVQTKRKLVLELHEYKVSRFRLSSTGIPQP